MPKAPSTETGIKRPDPDRFFTDRDVERAILSEVLDPGGKSPEGRQPFLTVFYGDGGVGKSALGARARAMAQEKKKVVLAAIDFDTSSWTKDSPFTAVAGEVVRAMGDSGIPFPLTTMLLALHSIYSIPSGEGEGRRTIDLCLEALGKGAEIAQGVPGLSTLLKAGKWMYDKKQRDKVKAEIKELGLWPAESSGRIEMADLEQKTASALFEDMKNHLKKNPATRVILLLDGFERIQSHERKVDSQMRLQEFLGYCAASREREAFARFKVVILGRRMLHWDELYEDPDWKDNWRQTPLNGLAEADARDYLGRWKEWFTESGHGSVSKALAGNEDDILRASSESDTEEPYYSPFYLTLAVDHVQRRVSEGQAPDLGRTPVELQDRFLKYLDRAECRALKILSLAGTFDEELFDWLAENRLIEYPVHSFQTALKRDHSYFQEAELLKWRFHRLFSKALLSRWTANDAERQECQKIIKHLLEFYAAPLLKVPERDWTEKEVDSWVMGMEVLVGRGLEGGLLEYDEWKGLFKEAPWSTDSYKCMNARLDHLKRILAKKEMLIGPEHHDTLTSVNNLAYLLNSKGDLAGAEPLYRRALEARERVLGPEHPDTLTSVSNLASLLDSKGDLAGAEPLCRRALETRERVLGPEHPDTLTSVNNLAVLLGSKGDLAGAAPLHLRALEGREHVLGFKHPDTLTSANNLAYLLKSMGDLARAEPLYRCVLEVQERILGPEHPATLTSVSNLASLLMNKGDLAAAEPLYRRALEARERILGPEHPDTLSSVNNLAYLLKSKGDLAGAETLYRRVLEVRERILGPEHPATLTSVSNLASLLMNKGDLAAAEPLYRRALEARERILGPEHPDTLTSGVSYLAFLLCSKGDIAGAEPLYRRALEAIERILGPEHPDTLTIKSNLAALLKKKEDSAKVVPIFKDGKKTL